VNWLDAQVDGLALLLAFGLAGCVFLLVAWVAERHLEPRDRRGEFSHQSRVAQAKRRMASDLTS
jgi:hypothetical protein